MDGTLASSVDVQGILTLPITTLPVVVTPDHTQLQVVPHCDSSHRLYTSTSLARFI